jgi:hypothetical protein
VSKIEFLGGTSLIVKSVRQLPPDCFMSPHSLLWRQCNPSSISMRNNDKRMQIVQHLRSHFSRRNNKRRKASDTWVCIISITMKVHLIVQGSLKAATIQSWLRQLEWKTSYERVDWFHFYIISKTFVDTTVTPPFLHLLLTHTVCFKQVSKQPSPDWRISYFSHS